VGQEVERVADPEPFGEEAGALVLGQRRGEDLSVAARREQAARVAHHRRRRRAIGERRDVRDGVVATPHADPEALSAAMHLLNASHVLRLRRDGA